MTVIVLVLTAITAASLTLAICAAFAGYRIAKQHAQLSELFAECEKARASLEQDSRRLLEKVSTDMSALVKEGEPMPSGFTLATRNLDLYNASLLAVGKRLEETVVGRYDAQICERFGITPLD